MNKRCKSCKSEFSYGRCGCRIYLPNRDEQKLKSLINKKFIGDLEFSANELANIVFGEHSEFFHITDFGWMRKKKALSYYDGDCTFVCDSAKGDVIFHWIDSKYSDDGESRLFLVFKFKDFDFNKMTKENVLKQNKVLVVWNELTREYESISSNTFNLLNDTFDFWGNRKC